MAVTPHIPIPSLEQGGASREALNRVLSSTAFSQVERIKRFLRFVAEEALAGRGDRLKEFLVGVEVFDKPESFDPRADPIVRVQARRLRAKLADYYDGEGRTDPIRIDLPKGTYVPSFAPNRTSHGAPPRTVAGDTIAVLSFADHSPAADQEYFCRGMSDEIISALTKVESLRVIPWSRSFRLEDHVRGILEIAEELNIARVVDGSVRKLGESLRITVQLVDARKGHYVWSETFDRCAKDVFAIQEEIAGAIVERLKGAVGAEGKLIRHSTANVTAYNLYLRGRFHTSQRSEAALRKAVECFELAIVEDSKYALAYSGLADAHALLANYGYLPPMETWSKAVAAATSAILLDEYLAEAHTSLAHVRATHDWNWTGAEAEFRKAIELNPRYAAAHHWFGMSTLAPLTRLDEAIAHVETALRLDPVSSIFSRDLAQLYFFRRDFNAALEQSQQTIDQDPHFYGAHWIKGLVYEQLGDFHEAAACFQHAIQLTPDNPRMLSALGRTLALSGKKHEARKILRMLDDLDDSRYVSPLDPALIHLALEDRDKAFERLNKLCTFRCFDLIHIRVDPRFDSLRDDRRFTAIVHRIALD